MADRVRSAEPGGNAECKVQNAEEIQSPSASAEATADKKSKVQSRERARGARRGLQFPGVGEPPELVFSVVGRVGGEVGGPAVPFHVAVEHAFVGAGGQKLRVQMRRAGTMPG